MLKVCSKLPLCMLFVNFILQGLFQHPILNDEGEGGRDIFVPWKTRCARTLISCMGID